MSKESNNISIHNYVIDNTPKQQPPKQSIFNVLSPNLNITNTEWSFPQRGGISKLQTLGKTFKPAIKNQTPTSNISSAASKSLHRRSSSTLSFAKHRTLGELFNDKYTTPTPIEKDDTSTKSKNSTSPRKIRRTNTNELLDRFIPNRQTTKGKLSLEKTKSLPAFALPYEHIERQNSEIYQSSVAEACGLDVGQRILQFQPTPPQSKGLKRNQSFNQIQNFKTRQLISTSAAQSRMKKIPTCPEKVLDAPGLLDDFYLNLISWSSENVLAIALDKSVYIWNATTGSVDLAAECQFSVTSLSWSPDCFYLSIGLNNGSVEIWDMESNQKLRTMSGGHQSRIGVHSWNDHLLSSGDRDGLILHNDVRISNHIVLNLEGHIGEVCGMSWRGDGLQMASGGNDNLVNIWDARTSVPLFSKTAHNAAVKALSWCPDQLSLLATGGGSSCKSIHFWNTSTGSRVNTIQTDSQVSSLHWGFANGIGREILSTHGFPNNEISLYSYPSLQKTGVILESHESRVLNSCLSPDGTTIATIASDENLKFWKIWDAEPEIKGEFGKNVQNGKVMTIR